MDQNGVEWSYGNFFKFSLKQQNFESFFWHWNFCNWINFESKFYLGSETSIRRRRQKLQVEEIWEWKIQLSISFAPQGRFLYPIQNCIPFCTVLHYSRLHVKLRLEFFFRESAFKQKRCRLQNLNPIKSNLLHPVEEMYFVMDKDFFVVLKSILGYI